jgi:hypothetical protein
VEPGFPLVRCKVFLEETSKAFLMGSCISWSAEAPYLVDLGRGNSPSCRRFRLSDEANFARQPRRNAALKIAVSILLIAS